MPVRSQRRVCPTHVFLWGGLFYMTSVIRNQRRKLLISIYDTPGFADFEIGRACAPTGYNGQQAAMAHHLHAPVEHRCASVRAHVLPRRVSPASYDPRSTPDAPCAHHEPPVRSGRTELTCLLMRTRGSLNGSRKPGTVRLGARDKSYSCVKTSPECDFGSG